ncbi:Uncharacterised protein [Bordetella pertussis]|nr:Uncharacterised protein [Bordetella pertussis]CFP66800.1 Uncharacterised protein [Bordetella pertussis]
MSCSRTARWARNGARRNGIDTVTAGARAERTKVVSRR